MITSVDYSYQKYDRIVLKIGENPFFYNGIQLRIDKVKEVYDYTDDQILELFHIAAKDGFTVVNCQIRWMDIQPDRTISVNQMINNEENCAFSFDLDKSCIQIWDGAKIRIYVNSLEGVPELRLYGFTNGTAHDLGTTPHYDPVNCSHYYDYDVTDYINDCGIENGRAEFHLRTEGSGKAVIDGIDDEHPPKLILSSAKSYDWNYIDKVIGWANEAGIKLELLWFGTDTVSCSLDHRVPFYVFHKYQKSLQANEPRNPFFMKQRNHRYGIYCYLMCKNDLELRKQEKAAIKALFNHIAEYDTAHGCNRTVIGCQVANEPGIGRIHLKHIEEFCYCDQCTALRGNMLEQRFRDKTMWEYLNNLAEGVKTSAYPVWTRVNNILHTDALTVEYNEAKRLREGTNLDFVGIDPYSTDPQIIYNYGHLSVYTLGKNLPMLMENGGDYENTAELILAALAGGSFYNVYDLLSPDSHGLYDNSLGNVPIPHGDYIEKVRRTNKMLNKIAPDLATRRPDGAGGTTLLFFNPYGHASDKSAKNSIFGEIIYHTKSGGIGIAVLKNEHELILLSTASAEFTLWTGKQIQLNSYEVRHVYEI